MHHFLQQRQAGCDRHAGFGKSDRDDRFAQIGRARSRENRLPFNVGFAAFLRRPDFIAHRIVNHADDDFALKRNAIETQKCGMP